MSNESNYVVNFKTPTYASIITVRADDAPNLVARLEETREAVLSAVRELEEALHAKAITEQQAVANVTAAFNGTVVSAPPVSTAPAIPAAVAPVAPPVAPPAVAAPVGGSAPVCSHGQMIGRKGSGAKGEWRGFFCPTPKGTADQCSPQFAKRGSAEWNLVA